MRDAQRYGACDGNEPRMGGLHPNGEPDNFLLQPSLPLTQATWLGARLVFKHRRVPPSCYEHHSQVELIRKAVLV